MAQTPEPRSRSALTELLGFLRSDPDNLSLISEAATAALAEGRPDTARELLDRRATLAPLPDNDAATLGLALLQLAQVDRARTIFAGLHQRHPEDPSLRFNLAWTKTLTGDLTGASALLDRATMDALPQAAALGVQVLHQQGNFDEAWALAKAQIVRHPQHQGLLAAASVLAVDMEDMSFARECAIRAGDQPDALTTLGTLALSEHENGAALTLFNRALAANSNLPRAWIGKGLAEMAAGKHEAAAVQLKKGAELFGGHVGSWIAAGWAALLSGEQAEAQACFERALALDHNFSESHGSLAVIYILQGRLEEARRSTSVALRLDSASFSAALAQTMLLAGQNDRAAARAVFERAITTPISANGATIADAMRRLSFKNS